MILGRISDVLERDSDINLSRRQFLSASAALGGGLLIGFTAGRSVNAAGAAEKIASEPFAPNAFLQLFGEQHRDGRIGAMAHLEVGHDQRDLTDWIDTNDCAGVTRLAGAFFCSATRVLLT